MFVYVDRCFGAWEDKELLRRDICPCVLRDAEVFRKNFGGVVGEDFGCEERVVFGEITVVEDEEEFYTP